MGHEGHLGRVLVYFTAGRLRTHCAACGKCNTSHAVAFSNRHSPVFQWSRIVYARRQVPAWRTTRGSWFVCCCRLQLDWHSIFGWRRQGACRLDCGWPSANGSVGRRCTSRNAIPKQSQLPARSHRRVAWFVVRNALAIPSARNRPWRSPLRVARSPCSKGRLLRRSCRVGAN